MCFRSDKDDAGRQLDPTQIPSGIAIQTPSNATELGQKRMPSLDGATDATDPRLPRASALGRLHPKARRLGAGLGGAVAIGAIGTGMRQIPWVRGGYRGFRWRRLHDHRLQYGLRLHAVVGPRLGNGGTQRQTVLFGR
jgi:hypothetical protein